MAADSVTSCAAAAGATSSAVARATASIRTSRMPPPPPEPSRPLALPRRLLIELGGAPTQGGAEPLLLPDLVELDPDLGATGVERGQDVQPGPDRVAEAGRVRAAV